MPKAWVLIDSNYGKMHNTCIEGERMYTVIFPSGKVEVFSVRAAAETFARAYRGFLITPEMVKVFERMANV